MQSESSPAAWPVDEAYERRRLLYQLYHVLNHLNLFGLAWLSRANSLLDLLIEE